MLKRVGGTKLVVGRRDAAGDVKDRVLPAMNTNRQFDAPQKPRPGRTRSDCRLS